MQFLTRLVGSLALACGLTEAAPARLLKSRATEGVHVKYQETTICETTPGVKSYSGYLTLPPTKVQPYSQKVFFWFFEARSAPEQAPLALWFQGGPGAASIDQALGENGPCIVQADSNSTVLNPWSWNNEANLLYIDQPVQTGFSYDEATLGLLDLISGDVITGADWMGPVNDTMIQGTFGSQDPTRLANTTATAAEAIWQFMQIWMTEFEEYRRDEVHIWTQSYGGHWGPAIAYNIQSRSEMLQKQQGGVNAGNSNSSNELNITVGSLGIVNGFIDLETQMPHFPGFAINNTYGIQAYDVEIAQSAMDNFTMPGGCNDQIAACKALMPNGYHDAYGTNDTISEVCGSAFAYCWENVYFAYDALSGRNPFDIAHPAQDSFPPPYGFGYLTRNWVKKALGVKVDYLQNSNPITNAFFQDGDFLYGGFMDDIGYLLDSGVKVALLNGDRDFRCNWVGGEAVSLKIDYKNSSAFAAAGYAEINTNSSYVGGMVRQHGSFSFSRVFESGHEVPFYQPETAYRIFMRTIQGRDVAMGNVSSAIDYATEGPASVFNITSEIPASIPPPLCYLSAPLSTTCTDEQIAALLNGTAVVENFIVMSPSAAAAVL